MNYQDNESADPDVFQNENCEKCGQAMVLKRGRYGQFLACSGYPDCKNTRRILRGEDGKLETKPDKLIEEKCPKCERQLVIKHGRYGEFTACSGYPDCKFIKQKEVGVPCPKDDCPGQIVERRSKRGKLFYGCGEYPNCDFTSWYKPLKEPCPQCGYPIIFEKTTKKEGPHLACTEDECDFKQHLDPPDGAEKQPAQEPEPAKA